MTERTRYTATCTCGHVGTVTCAENDAPFTPQWEHWSAIDLIAEKVGGDGTCLTLADALTQMGARCPSCNTQITPGMCGPKK